MTSLATRAYTEAGVDAPRADIATKGLVRILGTITARHSRRVVVPSGHYATVLAISDGLGLALSTDGVGSKSIIAERMRRFDTIGEDCIAMNANDVICVGAAPIALLDYLSVQDAEPEMLEQVAVGLKRGAEEAGLDIPGGEIAQLPDLLQSHGGNAFDLTGCCVGLVQLDRLITGDALTPGDIIIGLPSTGVHANGLSLARAAFDDLTERPDELGGQSVGNELLKPTAIYVRAVEELLESGVAVHGLAHITSDGFLNLPRLAASVGYLIDEPLPVPPIFDLVAERQGVEDAELWEVFNMGCGFCCVVPPDDTERALALLRRHYAEAAPIGRITRWDRDVVLPRKQLVGRRGDGFSVRSTAEIAEYLDRA